VIGNLVVAGPAHRPRHSRVPVRTAVGRRRVSLAAVLLLLAGLVALGATFWHEGYRIYVVHTGSMEPTYRPGDLVIDKAVHGTVQRGEVITFRHSDLATDVVTHRVVGVSSTGQISTKGDANRSADAWRIRPDQVQGRVAFRLRGLGYFAVYLRQPAGVASLATALFAIAALWSLFFPSPPAGTSGGSIPAKVPS